MGDPATTKEPQYQRCLQLRDEMGLQSFGLMSNQTWLDDPKRLLFVLSRYKFVAKVLEGARRVLEVGCADAFGSRIVLQAVGSLTVVDFDPVFIADVRARAVPQWPMEARVHDMLEGPVPGRFDAVFALDVLEHIEPRDERTFLDNMMASLEPTGAAVIGMPSIFSQAHASPQSREGHVNCKDAGDLRSLLSDYFHQVVVFSMNDEVVHTGFAAMANYYLALCQGRRI